MSTYYNFYTEALVDGTWYCIDHRVLQLERNDRPMTYKLNCTYWNGSRSYFGEAYDKLEEVGRPIRLADTSTEFRMLKILGWRGDDGEVEKYYDRILYTVSYKDLSELFAKSKQPEYSGIYKKTDINQYEAGELEDLYELDIDPVKYSQLVDDARAMYQYYEWNDSMSWRVKIPVLYKKVTDRVAEFEDVNCLDCEDVRILMYTD